MSITQPQAKPEKVTHAVHAAAASWHAFWFAPADPFPLGIIRLLTGGMLVYNLLIWGTDLSAFFYVDGLQPLSAITQFYKNDLVFSFLYWVPDAQLLQVHWACVVVAVMFCLGVLTRVTSVLAFLITISYSQRVPVANFGLDQILAMLCLYLAVGPSGASLSVDALFCRLWRKRVGAAAKSLELSSARTALRLIQVHVCVIYFWAGFAKLKGDSWWTGEAMWQVIANQEYQTTDLTWMAWVPWLPYLIAHVTVAWEVSFCAMVWNERLRPFWLAVGTAMHVGIGAFLGMWTFGLIMTFPYFAFSDGKKWRRRMTLFQSAQAVNEQEPPASDDSEHLTPAQQVSEAPDAISKIETDEDYDPWAASEPFVTGVDADVLEETADNALPLERSAVEIDLVAIPPADETSARPAESTATAVAESAIATGEENVEGAFPVDAEAETAQHTDVPVLTSGHSRNEAEQNPRQVVDKDHGARNSDSDSAQELFRKTMGLSAEPIRIKPAAPRRLLWSSTIKSDLQFADQAMKETRVDVADTATPAEGDVVMDDDYVIMGETAPTETMVYASAPNGLLDSATPFDEEDSGNSAELIEWQASVPDRQIHKPIETNDLFPGALMSDTNQTNNENSDSPDAGHVLTTSKRMDRIKPKTANSLTGAPPPKVDGRVEDSVLAPETEVLLVAVHAPERNTFRTYLRRHDIPCRAAVSAENAVSIVLGMRPAAVLISGSMMNPEEIITLVDDLTDMVDAPILALLTGSQIKLLSNDPLSAHVLQYPASLRQVRAELTEILLGEGNARPRCSLRSAMIDE